MLVLRDEHKHREKRFLHDAQTRQHSQQLDSKHSPCRGRYNMPLDVGAVRIVSKVDADFENCFNADDEEEGGNADGEIETILHLTVKEGRRRDINLY